MKQYQKRIWELSGFFFSVLYKLDENRPSTGLNFSYFYEKLFCKESLNPQIIIILKSVLLAENTLFLMENLGFFRLFKETVLNQYFA